MNRKEALSLILRSEAAVIRGVGRAYGRTILKYGEKRYDARHVSEALGNAGEPFIILGGKTGTGPEVQETKIPLTLFEELGLGPLGCFIDGAPILPVPMKAADLLRRGIPGGFWTAFEFGACSWAEDGAWETEFPGTEFPGTGFPEIPFRETFFRHLDFLRTYGIPGGAVLESPEEAAALLGSYLSGPGAGENCRILIFLRRNFFRLLGGIAPEEGEEFPDTLSPRPGAVFRLYETLLKDTGISKDPWDILILTDPGEFLADAGEGRFNRLGNINARLRLGIFTGGKSCGINPLFDHGNNAVKRFFGIQGEARDLTRYLFRDLRIPCPLPPSADLFHNPVRRPPEPFPDGDDAAEHLSGQQNFWSTVVTHGCRFRILGKFQGLNIPLYKDELELFPFNPSPARIFPEDTNIADPEEGRLPVFSKLNREQRDYFLYWREEFRKERHPAANLPCIYLYARELILTMGGGNPGEYFRELLSLWRIYRGGIPKLDRFFPNWLVDFAVLYGIAGTALDELLPFAEDAGNGMLKDLFLHKNHIEQKHPVLLKNLIVLFPDKTRMTLQNENPFLAAKVEAALNKIDRYLQERCQKNLFEFFYPSGAVPLHITAFAPFDDLGLSSYSAEWMGFCEHEPLKQFLNALVLYLYARLKGRSDWPIKSGVSPRGYGHPWHQIIDEALGFPIEPEAPFPGISPDEKKPVPAKLRIETEKLTRLREESDKVRELLRIEADEAWKLIPSEKAGFPQGAAFSVTPEESRTRGSPEAAGEAAPAQAGETGNTGVPDGNPAGFLAALDTTERAALKLIARRETREELEALAKTAGVMPELLIDGINEKFQGYFQDLLIVTEQNVPVVQKEYIEAFRKLQFLGST